MDRQPRTRTSFYILAQLGLSARIPSTKPKTAILAIRLKPKQNQLPAVT